MKVIAFGASYSTTSINRQFAHYAATYFRSEDVEVLNLLDYVVPMFTVDVESAKGHPEGAKQFVAKLEEADLLIISMGEHNGSYEAAFKNLFDWASRIKSKTFDQTKMLLLSTSPGSRGGKSVLAQAEERFPRHGAEILASFSLPNFDQNFSSNKGILVDDLRTSFEATIQKVKAKII
ncbi:NADPH-dependent FMN reductase [Parvicella tangerina]|uniref:NADPH-dependent FMN reductase-like domain-containing protein n=1 Tax=Parvicella tangerina TaxID=2829795 RepID=A0A916JM31_9FLAO|nr:NADPH-dependent FMN reductase [Parvicella tangerina]CAG5080186.1 hypothetical protein CRYO30217_01212 [Parvicella tangerina]